MLFPVGCLLLLFSAAVLAKDVETKKPYKFLVFSPQHSNSIVNYMGKISDSLVDAGHHVTMISPLIDSKVGTTGTKKAVVIEIPQTPEALKAEEMLTKLQQNIWNAQSIWEQYKDGMDMFDDLMNMFLATCKETLHYPGLLERIRREKIDVGYAAATDICAFGIFHLAGITKFVVTQTEATLPGFYSITHTPDIPSYVPGLLTPFSEKMTFFERFSNCVGFPVMAYYNDNMFRLTQEVFEVFQPGFPLVSEIAANSSLIFLNSEPLIDFPRPTTHKIVEIGGIVSSGNFGKLNKTWSDIMDLRPRTVLLSFGSFAKAHMMPQEYKVAIRDALSAFPNVTFIWKYEKPEDNVSGGVPNIIESTWVPQNDMLHDSRLTAFITHCGQCSTTEANVAGVPMLVIPIGADQWRNAQQIKRSGVGLIMDKGQMAEPGFLEGAIRELLDNGSAYRSNARRVAQMIADRPFTMKEILVRNMEFVAEYGPLRMLDHYGTKLSFVEFYLIDVFAFLAAIVLITLTVLAVVARFVLKKLFGFVRRGGKRKVE